MYECTYVLDCNRGTNKPSDDYDYDYYEGPAYYPGKILKSCNFVHTWTVGLLLARNESPELYIHACTLTGTGSSGFGVRVILKVSPDNLVIR